MEEKKVTFKTAKVPTGPTLVEIAQSFKLIVSPELEKKIRYLCNKMSDLEWSGVLFYEYTGNWEDSTLSIYCLDLCLMDVGTSTYTEFDMSPDTVAYMCDHNLMGVQTGLIHSHNRMATFFSGTDLDTLKDEGNRRNHFVSLIVNNEGDYTAAITRKAEISSEILETVSYKSFNDEAVGGIKVMRKEKHTEIQYADMKIEIEGRTQEEFTEIDRRLTEIKESKKAVKPVKSEKSNDSFKSLGYVPKLDFMEPDSFQSHPNITPEYVHSCVMQILTGSVLAGTNNKLDAFKWAPSMPSLFGKRFKTLKDFSLWAETYCDFIISEGDFGNDSSIETLAEGIIRELDRLPKNVYIEELINILSQWIMY